MRDARAHVESIFQILTLSPRSLGHWDTDGPMVNAIAEAVRHMHQRSRQSAKKEATNVRFLHSLFDSRQCSTNRASSAPTHNTHAPCNTIIYFILIFRFSIFSLHQIENALPPPLRLLIPDPKSDVIRLRIARNDFCADGLRE